LPILAEVRKELKAVEKCKTSRRGKREADLEGSWLNSGPGTKLTLY